MKCQQNLRTSSERSDFEDAALSKRCDELLDIAQSMSELEYTSQAFSKIKSLFSHWLKLHIYLTVILFAMIIVHVLATTYYGLRWLP